MKPSTEGGLITLNHMQLARKVFSSLLEDWIHWPLPYGVNEERHDFLSSAEPAGAFDSSDFKRFET